MQMTLTRRAVFSMKEVIVALKHAYPDQVEVQMLPDNATRTDVKHVQITATNSTMTFQWDRAE